MQKDGWQVPDHLMNPDHRTHLEERTAVWYLEYETSDITRWVSRGNEMAEISSFGGERRLWKSSTSDDRTDECLLKP